MLVSTPADRNKAPANVLYRAVGEVATDSVFALLSWITFLDL